MGHTQKLFELISMSAIRVNKVILLFLMAGFLLCSSCKSKMMETPIKETAPTTYLNDLSEDFLKRIIAGQETQDIQDHLAKVSLKEILDRTSYRRVSDFNMSVMKHQCWLIDQT